MTRGSIVKLFPPIQKRAPGPDVIRGAHGGAGDPAGCRLEADGGELGIDRVALGGKGAASAGQVGLLMGGWNETGVSESYR